MPRRSSARLALQGAQLAQAAPEVVALRVGRMLAAGPTPSPSDQREFMKMGAEKVAAFYESWLAMSMQTLRVQQRFMAWWLQESQRALQSGVLLWPGAGGALSAQAAGRAQAGALRVAASGLAPVRRRAVANARRLRGRQA